MASKNLRLILPAAALLGAGVWGYQRWEFSRAHESTDNAQVDGHIVPVVAKVGGYVTEIDADDNVHVEAKHVLVKLDKRELEARLAQANADLSAARATAGGHGFEGQAVAAVNTASSQRDAGNALVEAAEAQMEKARSDLGRAKELFGKHIISAAQLDAAQTAYNSSAANLAATRRQVAAATSGIANAEAGVRLARARLDAAEALRDNAALQLSYATIEAPVAGIVSRRQVESGQLVQPGQTVLVIVADTGVYVTANMKETQLARIRVGQKVDLTVDAYDAKAEGEVESIASATGAKFALLPPDNATGNFTKVVQRVPVRIRITKDLGVDRPLKPGMSVYAAIRVR